MVAVSAVGGIVDHQTLLLGVSEPPDVPEELGGLSREHWAEYDLDAASFCFHLIIKWRGLTI